MSISLLPPGTAPPAEEDRREAASFSSKPLPLPESSAMPPPVPEEAALWWWWREPPLPPPLPLPLPPDEERVPSTETTSRGTARHSPDATSAFEGPTGKVEKLKRPSLEIWSRAVLDSNRICCPTKGNAITLFIFSFSRAALAARSMESRRRCCSALCFVFSSHHAGCWKEDPLWVFPAREVGLEAAILASCSSMTPFGRK
mmetsp:Transcript_24452/g.53155  ORF Transcript_24452/g.53155 Transcript_24452/m.53155 type:complete len:201 (+) Transcript_24452:1196-1798(+)